MTRDERTSALLSLMRANVLEGDGPVRCDLKVWEAELELAAEESIQEAALAANDAIDSCCARGGWIL